MGATIVSFDPLISAALSVIERKEMVEVRLSVRFILKISKKNGIMNGKDSAESELDFQKKRAFKVLQTVEVTIRRKNEYY